MKMVSGRNGGKGATGAALVLCAVMAFFLCVFAPAAAAEAGPSASPQVAATVPAATPSAPSIVRASGFRMAGDAEKMRIVVDLDGEAEPKWFLLRSPYRLVIDLPATRLSLDAADLKGRGLVRNVRCGTLPDGTARLVLAGKGSFRVDRLDVLKNEDGAGFHLVAEISAASPREFEAALADQAITTGSVAEKGHRVGTGPISEPAHRFTVVVDPGHGGIDGGAEGVSGTVEKDVTLAFARLLRDKLVATGKYDVFMTRDSDVFLRLDDRVRIARQHEADLFISVHADTIAVKSLRGATVYTISDKASDPEAQALADRENLSDRFAGMEIKADDTEVTDILIDLIRRETHSFSLRFARTLVGQLSSTVGLINNPHREAGFRVLKAPDVPSVLVELGYLSNARDEAQLVDPGWRDKASDSIARAVALFAEARRQTGG